MKVNTLAKPNSQRRNFVAHLFFLFTLASVIFSLVALLVLLVFVLQQGAGSLSLKFLTTFPSRFPSQAGLKSALYGSIWLVVLTAAFCLPVGIAAAVYLEEYAKKNFFSSFVKLNISNLAGVPSIVYGIFGLTLFVRALALGRSVLAGALTLALLVLPIVIVAAQEAIRAVPNSLREAAYALGATKWQVVRQVVLPTALSNIVTGVILALSRAIGETAPLIMIGALTFVAFVPEGPLSPFTALPIQIFNWISRPQAGFHQIAASGIIVLLLVVLVMNGIATYIRYKYYRHLG